MRKEYKPKRLRAWQWIAGALRLLAVIVRFWPFWLLAALLISPVSPYLRWRSTNTNYGNVRHYQRCEYLGLRGKFIYTAWDGKCPLVLWAGRRDVPGPWKHFQKRGGMIMDHAPSKDIRKLSYASSIPDLWERFPASLRNAGSIRKPFEEARHSRQAASSDSSQEPQSPEPQESGSSMVKRHGHVPTLRPANHHAITASSFSQSWFQEQRAARLRQTQAETLNDQREQDAQNPGHQQRR